ncbi:hypothetical protein PIB30_045186 [Stylosanthes scabra]|uniref:Peptidase A1 domain-containing protein n=1 Tax=Stylosanthes scabra TaxID=79078 RepID=A0ABU6ZEV1_9FABA|nr:hypothetical protein [Stylosanthes scabra]
MMMMMEHRCICMLVAVLVMNLLASHGGCNGLHSFAYDMHHLFSDPVKGVLGAHDFPHKGTPQYYAVMEQRDRLFRGRRLAADQHHTPLTFAAGNETYQIDSFGFLHFANVSVGTPALWFLVALDTGSDLFWLPCNCTSCVHGLKTSSGKVLELNIYDMKRSSTSHNVLCNSSLCEESSQCTSSGSTCPYQVKYLSNGTSTTGILVEDVLHLVTDDDHTKDVDTPITLGCGQVQTGAFLDGAAPNGLFGLGLSNISVPSILANQGLILNSFSMCFGLDGLGRITFGDNTSLVQGQTPFNLRHLHPTYNITITQIILGGIAANLEFDAIFDSGTSFTYLNDPAYTQITKNFNSMIKQERHSSSSGSENDLPFDFCYNISPNQTIEVPTVNLTMKGGDNYFVIDPIVTVTGLEVELLCLGVLKSDNVNIIGQNFMTGYRIIFDRENMVLGWKESNCYDDELANLNINQSHSPAISPAIAVNPEATSNVSSNDPGKMLPSHSFNLRPNFAFVLPLFFILAIS